MFDVKTVVVPTPGFSAARRPTASEIAKSFREAFAKLSGPTAIRNVPGPNTAPRGTTPNR